MAVMGLATYPESSPTAFTTRRTAAENSKNRMRMKRGLLRTREENEGEGKREKRGNEQDDEDKESIYLVFKGFRISLERKPMENNSIHHGLLLGTRISDLEF